MEEIDSGTVSVLCVEGSDLTQHEHCEVCKILNFLSLEQLADENLCRFWVVVDVFACSGGEIETTRRVDNGISTLQGLVEFVVEFPDVDSGEKLFSWVVEVREDSLVDTKLAGSSEPHESGTLSVWLLWGSSVAVLVMSSVVISLLRFRLSVIFLL